MEEIKVGEYIRDRAGNIAKVMKNHNIMFEIELNTGARINQFKEFIAKHSKNIIDLIERGDYVNGREVKHIAMFEGFPNYPKLIFVDETHLIPDDTCENDEIKTILTHEQFEQNSYKV